MKLHAAEVFIAGYPTEDEPPKRRSFALLRLTTDTGVVGWGEASDCYGHRHPAAIGALFDEDFAYALVGQDVEPLENLVERIRLKIHPTLGARELASHCLSAIEIALWDIRGKVLGKSVSELLGRHRDTVPIYAGGKPAPEWGSGEHLEFFRPLIDRGTEAVKLRTGRSLASDIDLVRAVRAGLPERVELLVDGKYNYRPQSAVAFATALAEIGVGFLEEPVTDVDLEQVAWVAARSPVPLAYGEHSFSPEDFLALARAGVRVLEPDAAICGGISQLLRIAELGSREGCRIVPHCGGLTAVGMAANLHAASSLPRLDYLEYDARPYQPLRDLLSPGTRFGPEAIIDGRLPVPDGPGLGVEPQEEVLREYPHEVDVRLASSFPVYTTPHI